MKSFEGSMGWTFPDLNLNEFSATISETPEITRLNLFINELHKKIDEKDTQISLLNNNIAELSQAITELAYKLDEEIENSKNSVRSIAPNLVDHLKFIAGEISKKIIEKEILTDEKSLASIIDKLIDSKLNAVTKKIILNSTYYKLLSKEKLASYKNVTFVEDQQLSGNEIICTNGEKTVKFDLDVLISSYME